MGTDKKYNQSGKVAEATLLDGLLSIGLYTPDPSPALNTLNDHLVDAHFNLRANCIRKNSTQKEYNEKARALLHYFAPKYKDECTQIGALENSLDNHFIKNAPAPHKKTNTISALFDKIADIPKPETTYTPAAPKLRPIQPTKKISVEGDEGKTPTTKALKTTHKTTRQQAPLMAVVNKVNEDKPPPPEQQPDKKERKPLKPDDGRRGKPLNVEDIIEAAKLYYEDIKTKTGKGKYPAKDNKSEIKSGSLKGENWKNIDLLLRRGHRDLPQTDGGLPAFLREHGLHNDFTTEMVIEAAKIHKQDTGHWPYSNDKSTITKGPLKGERWDNIHTCLIRGSRGLPKTPRGLPQFLKENECCDKEATKDDVLVSMLHHRTKHNGEWPDQRTKGEIKDGTMLDGSNWGPINKKHSLHQVKLEYEKTYSKQDVINSILACKETHGETWGERGTDVIDVEGKLQGYKINALSSMKIDGLSVAKIMKEYRTPPTHDGVTLSRYAIDQLEP